MTRMWRVMARAKNVAAAQNCGIARYQPGTRPISSVTAVGSSLSGDLPGRARGAPCVVERSGERLEGVRQHRHDRLERLERAVRAAGQIDDQRPAADAGD